MSQQIVYRGAIRATPLRIVRRGDTLYGLFPGEDDNPSSYDQWTYYGEATTDLLAAIAAVGVRVDMEEVSQ
jgi:hypothetical protein